MLSAQERKARKRSAKKLEEAAPKAKAAPPRNVNRSGYGNRQLPWYLQNIINTKNVLAADDDDYS